MNELKTVKLTESAMSKIKSLVAKCDDNQVADIDIKRFRIEVQGGGCYGYVYKYSVEKDVSKKLASDDILMNITQQGDDFILEVCEEARTLDDVAMSAAHDDRGIVVIDSMTLELIAGSTLDYSIELQGEEFVMLNPGASSQCGCGVSFSV